jgi:CubicO group peptidase (beta-lactamase class C family)
MASRVLITTLLFLTCLHMAGQQDTSLLKQRIDQLVNTQLKKWKVPGCALAIVNGKEVVYAKGYGFRDVENKLPVTPNTVFKIASLTKSFTAATAGLLVGQKLLEWDRPVKEYLPQLELANRELTRQVTLRDLLSHRTGIYDDDWSWVGDHIDKKRLYEILSAMPQHSPPRTAFIYSNMTYALVGELVAGKSGRSWRQLVREHFFKPLAMNSSCFSHTDSSGLEDFAYGYEYADSSNTFVRGNLSEHYTDSLSVCEAFAFISSSALDLSQWLRLFINGGTWQGRPLIPTEVYRQLIAPVQYMRAAEYPEVSESYYGMGWQQNYYKGRQLLQHSGGLSGFKSYLSFMPQDSLGIVVLTNGQPYRFPIAVTYDLYDILLNLPGSRWTEKLLPPPGTAGSAPKAAVNVPGTQPSKPLAEFAGTYFSKWLGTMKVTYENGELYFQFHQYPKEKMKHAHYNTFYTEAEREPGNGITFQLDHDGRVKTMLLNEFPFERKD